MRCALDADPAPHGSPARGERRTPTISSTQLTVTARSRHPKAQARSHDLYRAAVPRHPVVARLIALGISLIASVEVAQLVAATKASFSSSCPIQTQYTSKKPTYSDLVISSFSWRCFLVSLLRDKAALEHDEARGSFASLR